MGTDQGFSGPMRRDPSRGASSGVRDARLLHDEPLPPRRVVVAHDMSLRTCDGLLEALELTLGSIETSYTGDLGEGPFVEVSSLGAARAVITPETDLVLVCLDLRPAPLAGVRLAEELIGSVPVVLVTRSLRWVPDTSTARDLPWIAPEAGAAELSHAMTAALAMRSTRASRASIPDVLTAS